MSHSMGRRAIVNGDEHNAYTRWRSMYCYLTRAGVVKKIKRTTHKRERREQRNAIRESAA
ncbi:hypothetical protein IAE22_31295 [Bacillus sp. S34]|nr:hypothetical protein [Bacillus sp. S34]